MKGYKLKFISRIKRDGSGTEPMKRGDAKHYAKDDFELNCLSMTYGTYIASGMWCFVVKIKDRYKKKI